DCASWQTVIALRSQPQHSQLSSLRKVRVCYLAPGEGLGVSCSTPPGNLRQNPIRTRSSQNWEPIHLVRYVSNLLLKAPPAYSVSSPSFKQRQRNHPKSAD